MGQAVVKNVHSGRSDIVPPRFTEQILSSFYAVLLRKIFPQKSNLSSTVFRNVRFHEEAV
jgi:hypothetical protein